MNPAVARMFVVLGIVVFAAGGWFLSGERVSRLEVENARLLRLLNEDRLIGTMRARSREQGEDEPAPGPLVAKKNEAPLAEELEDLEAARERIQTLEGELAELSLPLAEPNVASSVVNAAVRHGETLVTGGYLDGNGNFVFTMVTPEETTSDNGESAIHFAFREVAVPAESIAELGLESITSGARNTLQHGETWTSEEAESVIEKILQDPGSAMLTAPRVTTRPGQQASVELREEESSRTISVNASILPDQSGYALRMRVEHRGVENPVVEQSP